MELISARENSGKEEKNGEFVFKVPEKYNNKINNIIWDDKVSKFNEKLNNTSTLSEGDIKFVISISDELTNRIKSIKNKEGLSHYLLNYINNYYLKLQLFKETNLFKCNNNNIIKYTSNVNSMLNLLYYKESEIKEFYNNKLNEEKKASSEKGTSFTIPENLVIDTIKKFNSSISPSKLLWSIIQDNDSNENLKKTA